MKVKFDCPHCGHRLIADSAQAARRTACPRCRGEVRVPDVVAPETATSAETLLTTQIDTWDMRLEVHGSPPAIHARPARRASASKVVSAATNGQAPHAAALPTSANPPSAAPQPRTLPASPPSEATDSAPAAPIELEGWYVRPTGSDDTYGPATDQELDAWIAQGRVVGDSFLRRGDSGSWRQARDVLDRFEPKAPADAQLPLVPPAVPPVSTARKAALQRRPSRAQRLAFLAVLMITLAVLFPTMIYLISR